MIALAATMVAGACSTTPAYQPGVPPIEVIVSATLISSPPLVPAMPITAGLYMSPEFRRASVVTTAGEGPTLRFAIGSSAAEMLKRDMTALFASVIDLVEYPTVPATMNRLELVAIPQFSVADEGRFAISVRLVDRAGAPVASVRSETLTLPDLRPEPAGGVPFPHLAWKDPLGPALDQWWSTTFAKQRDRITLEPESASQLLRSIADVTAALAISPELNNWAFARGISPRWPAAPSNWDLGGKVGVVILDCSAVGNCRETAATAAIGDALKKLQPETQLVSPGRFLDAVYPWFRSGFRVDRERADLINQTALQQRAYSAGVRYAFILNELQSRTVQHGDVTFAGGYGGGGFFGYAELTRVDYVQADVIDFAALGAEKRIAHEREQPTLVIPAFFIAIPIPIPETAVDIHQYVAERLAAVVRAEVEAH